MELSSHSKPTLTDINSVKYRDEKFQHLYCAGTRYPLNFRKFNNFTIKQVSLTYCEVQKQSFIDNSTINDKSSQCLLKFSPRRAAPLGKSRHHISCRSFHKHSKLISPRCFHLFTSSSFKINRNYKQFLFFSLLSLPRKSNHHELHKLGRKTVSKSTNPATYPFWRLFVCFVPKVILFHGCREMFLITAAQINQFRNEGLKGCNKSFTTFFFFFSASQLVCAIFSSPQSYFSFFQLVYERPLCEMKSVRGWRYISSLPCF